MLTVARVLLVILAVVGVYHSSSARAGQLFPPENANGATSCPNSGVLTWSNNAVICVDPTPGVGASPSQSVSCTGGQMITAISNGVATCSAIPTCTSSTVLTFTTTNGVPGFTCTSVAQALNIPNCAANTALDFTNGAFTCKPIALPVCTTGQYLTSYDGATFVCTSLDTCSPNWTTTGVGQCTTSCGGGLQSITQSDGCGHTQTVDQACDTQACPVNGACGAASGTTVTSAPTTGLCADGSIPTVSGTGPWSWSCTGSNSGTTASCSASITDQAGTTAKYEQYTYGGCAGAGDGVTVTRDRDASNNFVYAINLVWRGDYSGWYYVSQSNITSTQTFGGQSGRDTVYVELLINANSPYRDQASLIISSCSGYLALPASTSARKSNAYQEIDFGPTDYSWNNSPTVP